MKKLGVFLLISVMAAGAVGCGKKAETAATSGDAAAVTASSAAGAAAVADLPDFSAFYGMWYNVDTSLAEVELSEEGLSLRGEVLPVVDVITEESTNGETNAAYTSYTLYTEAADDGLSLKAVFTDETGTNAEYKSMELFDVDRNNDDAGAQVGSYVNDIQYTNGDLASTENVAPEDTDSVEVTTDPALSSDSAQYYLLDSVETSDGKKQSKDEYSDQEFALIYSVESPVMSGMMFSTDTSNMFMLSSADGVMQITLDVPSSDGSTENVTLPVTFDEKAGTMTLDCSGTDLGLKKMIFKQADADEFFSGNRAILNQ